MDMNVDSLGTVVHQASDTRLAQIVAASAQAGSTIEMTQGVRYRVLSKSASADGLRLRIALHGGGAGRYVGVQELADLGILSRPLRRFAGLIHRILANASDFDLYVNSAIERAGLPTDPSMNWGKWLMKVYSPVTQMTGDSQRTEEAIHSMLIRELYDRQVISKNFDPNHKSLEGKDLEKKVSAFLSNLFKLRVSQAIDEVKLENGAGMAGAIGREPTDSLQNGSDTDSEEEDDRSMGDLGPLGKGQDNRDIADFEGADEIQAFAEDYKDAMRLKQREVTALIYSFFVDSALRGDTREEMRTALQRSSLRNRDGVEVSNETFKKAIAAWARSVAKFAMDPRSGWADKPLGKHIAWVAGRLAKANEERKRPEPVASGLNTAQAEPELAEAKTSADHRVNLTGPQCSCGHPASFHGMPPDFGCEEEKNGCDCHGYTEKKTAGYPASSNMLGQSVKPDDEDYDSTVKALANLAVERLEAPLPKSAMVPGQLPQAPGSAPQPPVVATPSQPVPQVSTVNPNVQQQADQTAQNGVQQGQPVTPENDFQQPGQGQEKKTIPPEIPGVNHTTIASSEDNMKQTASQLTPKKLAARESLLTSRKKATTPKVTTTVRYSRLRRVAATQPHEVDAAIRELSVSYRKIGTLLTNLRENLDLVPASKEASVKEKAAAKAKYGAEFKRWATEDPGGIETVLQEIYSQTDEIAEGLENLADNLGVQIAPEGDPAAEVPGEATEPLPDFGGDNEEPIEPAEETEESELA